MLAMELLPGSKSLHREVTRNRRAIHPLPSIFLPMQYLLFIRWPSLVYSEFLSFFLPPALAFRPIRNSSTHIPGDRPPLLLLEFWFPSLFALPCPALPPYHPASCPTPPCCFLLPASFPALLSSSPLVISFIAAFPLFSDVLYPSLPFLLSLFTSFSRPCF